MFIWCQFDRGVTVSVKCFKYPEVQRATQWIEFILNRRSFLAMFWECMKVHERYAQPQRGHQTNQTKLSSTQYQHRNFPPVCLRWGFLGVFFRSRVCVFAHFQHILHVSFAKPDAGGGEGSTPQASNNYWNGTQVAFHRSYHLSATWQIID